MLSGCAVGPNFIAPDNSTHDAIFAPRPHYTAVVATNSSEVPVQWWRLFNDEILTELQKRAQGGNIDLQIATERIEQSRAQLSIASSHSLPRVGADLSYANEALSEHGKFAALGAPTAASEFWQLGFDASWELDLWGKMRRMRENAGATLMATVLDRETARVVLSAELARAYLQLRGNQARLKIAQKNLKIAERVLALVDSRQKNGISTRFDTSVARARLAKSKAAIPELLRQRNIQLNAIALLLGENPRSLDWLAAENIPLPELPSAIPLGIPSELARRRPDIQSAEARLHAATAAIGIATADFYPRIGLRGRLGLESFEFDNLDSWSSRFFSIGPTLYLPVFQGGRLTQHLALSESREKTAALAYRQTVLRALHEVDNALDALYALQSQHAHLRVAVEQSRQALHAAEAGFREGVNDSLNVLAAQQTLSDAENLLNSNATNVTLALVNLYKSLGGGWSVALAHQRPQASADLLKPTLPQPFLSRPPAGPKLESGS